jgi:hypothetical protein
VAARRFEEAAAGWRRVKLAIAPHQRERAECRRNRGQPGFVWADVAKLVGQLPRRRHGGDAELATKTLAQPLVLRQRAAPVTRRSQACDQPAVSGLVERIERCPTAGQADGRLAVATVFGRDH